MRPAFKQGLVAGSILAGIATVSAGRLPRGSLTVEQDAETAVTLDGKQRSYPKPDGKVTFDKLSSVYASGNATRDDAPDHIRVQRDVPLELAEAWVNMCPAGVYQVAAGASGGTGTVTLEVAASNCVQCGAISARGGRLTPAEGGDGADYALM
jgi:electron-transferring-flavoprotein dehydrogenase